MTPSELMLLVDENQRRIDSLRAQGLVVSAESVRDMRTEALLVGIAQAVGGDELLALIDMGVQERLSEDLKQAETQALRNKLTGGR